MFIAPLISASRAALGHITVSCRGRVHRAPHLWQSMLVPGVHQDHAPGSFFRFPGEDAGELAPARRRGSTFSGRLGGHVRARCLPSVPLAERTMSSAMRRSSSAITSHSRTRARAVLWWKSAAGSGSGTPAPPRLRGGGWPTPAGLGLPPRRPAILPAHGQEPGIGDDLAVAGGGEPGHANVHADPPAGGGQRAGSLSARTITYQRRPSRLR